jgi:murein DD-endopeptidase MepM/ murein hydrolase activator NlpD
MIIPVVGVQRDDLFDSYSQARSGGRTHNAIDILSPRNTPVIAAVDGTIRKLFTSNAGGITIYQFDVAEGRVYYYAHLDHYVDGLAEGQFVRQGTVIGYVGTTGNTHGTPHLHFAIAILPPEKHWSKGTAVNPYPILMTAGATPVTTHASARR